MARCKVTNLVTTMSDSPPPYDRYDATNEHFTAAAAIPGAEVRTISNITGPKMISRRGCTYCAGVLIVIVLCALLTIEIFPYPLRASCTVQWGFDEPCKFVMQRLRCQLLKWTSCSDCGSRGNKCLYSLKKTKNWENDTIHATHLSPKLRLLDDIKIQFVERQNNSCIATAKSMSRAWFVIFDSGTNYCNLRNLVNGAQLDANRGFMELTSDAICTQFNTALCS